MALSMLKAKSPEQSAQAAPLQKYPADVPETNQTTQTQKSKMYQDAKTWNPAVGCNFACVYCAFRAVVAMAGEQISCKDCIDYCPHEHPERLRKIPSKDIIFAFGTGEISFYRKEFVEKAIDALIENLQRSKKEKIVYFQSKAPKCLSKYFDKLRRIRDKVVMLTTLETNRDEGYSDISKAPLPSIRYKDFLDLNWKRKIVTIEPIMDFDFDVFIEMIREISPEAAYLGFNSKSDKVKLPEPSSGKFWKLAEELRKFTEVRLKETRQSEADSNPGPVQVIAPAITEAVQNLLIQVAGKYDIPAQSICDRYLQIRKMKAFDNDAIDDLRDNVLLDIEGKEESFTYAFVKPIREVKKNAEEFKDANYRT